MYIHDIVQLLHSNCLWVQKVHSAETQVQIQMQVQKQEQVHIAECRGAHCTDTRSGAQLQLHLLLILRNDCPSIWALVKELILH